MLNPDQTFQFNPPPITMDRKQIAHLMNQILPNEEEEEMSGTDERLSDDFCNKFIAEWVTQDVDNMDIGDFEEFILGQWEQSIIF